MADLQVNNFTSYAMSEQEQHVSCVLSPNNIQMLCNLRATTATELLGLTLPTTEQERKEYEHNVIYAQCRIVFINELIAHHESALKYLQEASHHQLPTESYDGNIYSAFTNPLSE